MNHQSNQMKFFKKPKKSQYKVKLNFDCFKLVNYEGSKLTFIFLFKEENKKYRWPFLK